MRLLVQHGIAPSLAGQLRAVGDGVRALTQRDGVELGVTIALDGGGSIGETLRGSGSDLDFEPHRRLLRPGRRYVSLHTHPASTPPSHKDFLLLIGTPSMEVLIVVGVNGTWHVVSRIPSLASPDAQTARATFAATYVQLRPEYQRRVQAGLTTADQALAAMLDAIWRAVARRISLRYDRLREADS